MQSSATDPVEEPPASQIPDDVAALYLWANLPDATYRDFSASRRKLRAHRGRARQPPASHDPAVTSPDPIVMEPIGAAIPKLRSDGPLEADPDPIPALQAFLPTEPPRIAPQSALIPVETLPITLQEPQTRRFSTMDADPAPDERTQAPRSEPPQFEIQEFEIRESEVPDHATTAPSSALGAPKLVRSRWLALGISLPGSRPLPPSEQPGIAPILAVFAPTPGAGKTVLVATLGRALSLLGESVALAETSPGSPLSAHFSIKSLRPEDVCVISPAVGNPIALVTYNLDAAATNPTRQTVLAENFMSLGANAHRLLLDLTERAGWFLGHLIRPNLTVLIPVTPTMSSIISLQSIERFFRELAEPEESPLEPYYLIVQFDESLPVHRDVRDFLSRRVGDRLLPIVIRSASGVAQAFTKGMTVVDYAPNSPIAADYNAVATWLRALSPPVAPAPPPPLQHLSRWAHP